MKQNKSRKKEEASYFSRFLIFSIQFRIKFENDLVQLSNFIQISIRILQCFQLVGMILLIYASKSDDLSVLNLLIYLSKIARPYLFIQEISSFYKFSYLIVLLPLFIGNLALHYLHFRIEQLNIPLKQMLQFMWKQNIAIISFIHLCIYIRILFQNLLIIPIIDLLAQSYNYNFSYDPVSIINIFLISITLVWIIMILLIEYQVTLESINIDCTNFGSLRKSLTDLIEVILEIIIVILNVVMQESENSIYYLAILLLTIGLLTNLAVFTNYANVYQNQIIQLGISNFEIIIGVVFFILQLFKTDITSIEIVLVVLLYLPFNSMIVKQFEIFHYNILLPDISHTRIQKIQYRIANIYKITRLTPNVNYLILINILKKNHTDGCDNLTCKCKVTTDHNQIIYIYLGIEIIHFNQLIAAIKTLQQRFMYFLHYVYLINELGFNSQAFQQSNMLAYQNSAMGSQYRSSVTHRISSQSLDQKSSSNNRSKAIKEEGLHQIKLGKLNVFERSKLLILQDNIKHQMSSEFIKQDQSLSETLEHAVKLFLQSEDNNQMIKKRILQMLDTKKNFLLQIMKSDDISYLFDISKTIAISLQELEMELQLQYAKFPSQKMQALNAFFQAEIMNNYFQAFKISNLTSISDDKLMKMHAQSSFDLFSNRIDYLNFGFDTKAHRLQVLHRSNMSHELFQFSKDKFNLIKYIGSLLPDGFEQVHDQIVQGFLQTGNSKYFRKINMSFIRIAESSLKPVNFFFDINMANLDELTFVTFFQNIEQQSAFIFISNTDKIANITKNFCNKFGIASKHLQIIQNAFYKQKIHRVIPYYNELVEEQVNNPDFIESNNRQVSVQLYSVKFKLLNPETTADTKSAWDNSDNCLSYDVDIILHLRSTEYSSQYSIVEIQNARQIFNTSQTSHYQLQTNNKIETDNEDENLNVSSEQEVIAPNFLEDIKIEIVSDKKKYKDKSFSQRFDKNMSYEILNVTVRSPKAEQHLISPVNESSRIIAPKYFRANHLDEKSETIEDQTLKEQENINQIIQIQFDDIDQEMQDNIRMQMQIEKADAKVIHIDDIGSQVSSIAGIKTSRFFKKYEFIEKILTSKNFPIKFDVMVLFIILMVLIFQVQCILYFYNAQNDLARFLQEISMIQIRTNVIGPMDKFIVAQNILVYYIVFIYLGLMKQSTAATKSQFTEDQYLSIYNSLKSSLWSQMSNPYFLPFIINQNLTVQQAYYPKISNRTIAVNEALYILLEANFELTLTNFQTIITFDTSQAFVVYQYLNYELLNEYCKTLNQNILTYSINRSDTVKTKWYFILIPCLFCSIIFISLAYYYYQEYTAQYVKILTFYSMADVVWLLRDVERYKGITSLLSKDEDVMFKYTFDLELKEKFMMAEDFRKEKIAQKQKMQKHKGRVQLSNPKMPIIKNLIVFASLYGIYFLFCFISNYLAQVYFQKYPATTKFFNELSDLETSVNGIFSMRQLSYQIQSNAANSYYFFPNKSDAAYFIKQFQLHLDVITNYLQASSSFDQSLYITSDSFAEQLNLLMSTDTCNFLPKNLFTIAQPHCDAVYGGVLRRGYQAALTAIRDALQNEYISTNGFVTQTYNTEEQMEGGLIGAAVVSILRGQFQTFLVDQTNQLISDINIINGFGTTINILGFILLITMIRNYYIWEFSIVKRFLLLLPQSSLFLDHQVERQLRQIIVKDNLI